MEQTSLTTLPTIPALLARLRRQGIRLWAEGAELKFSAPPGVLTPTLRAELVERKPELLL